MSNRGTSRERLESALSMRLPSGHEDIGCAGVFNPWEHIIRGIDGCYSSTSDAAMIEVLEAVRDRETFALIERRGFIAEFMLYVLSGHGLIDYGMSPRGGFPAAPDLWQPLIDKWKAYAEVMSA